MKKSLFMLLTLIPMLMQGINLDDAISQAIDNNKELQSLAYDIQITEKDIDIAYSNALPQVNFEGGLKYTETHNPDAFTTVPSNVVNSLDENATANEELLAAHTNALYDGLIPDEEVEAVQVAGSINLQQLIYAGGTVSNYIDISKKMLDIKSKQYELQKRNTIYKTKELFYQSLLARDVVQITRESYDLANEHYKLVQKLYEDDMSSEYDMLRAELEVSKIEPQVQEAENNYEIVVSALEQHLGNISIASIEGSIELPVYEDFTLKQCYIEMLNNRIELQLTEKSLDIKKIQYDIAKGNFLPKVAFEAGVSLFSQDDELQTDGDYYGHEYSLGLGVSIPIFSGFSNSNNLKKSKIAIRQQNLNNADLEDKLRLEVKQNLLNLEKVEETVKTQEKNLSLAQTGYEIAQTRYNNQVGIQLELFDAQIQLEQAKLELKNAIYNVIINKEKLELSLGREL